MAATTTDARLTTCDETFARMFKWLPWLTFVAVSFPPPLIFLVLFAGATTTEAAASYAFLAILAAAGGIGVAVLIGLGLLFYRKRWLRKLTHRLPSHRLTPSEIPLF